MSQRHQVAAPEAGQSHVSPTGAPARAREGGRVAAGGQGSPDDLVALVAERRAAQAFGRLLGRLHDGAAVLHGGRRGRLAVLAQHRARLVRGVALGERRVHSPGWAAGRARGGSGGPGGCTHMEGSWMVLPQSPCTSPTSAPIPPAPTPEERFHSPSPGSVFIAAPGDGSSTETWLQNQQLIQPATLAPTAYACKQGPPPHSQELAEPPCPAGSGFGAGGRSTPRSVAPSGVGALSCRGAVPRLWGAAGWQGPVGSHTPLQHAQR